MSALDVTTDEGERPDFILPSTSLHDKVKEICQLWHTLRSVGLPISLVTPENDPARNPPDLNSTGVADAGSTDMHDAEASPQLPSEPDPPTTPKHVDEILEPLTDFITKLCGGAYNKRNFCKADPDDTLLSLSVLQQAFTQPPDIDAISREFPQTSWRIRELQKMRQSLEGLRDSICNDTALAVVNSSHPLANKLLYQSRIRRVAYLETIGNLTGSPLRTISAFLIGARSPPLDHQEAVEFASDNLLAPLRTTFLQNLNTYSHFDPEQQPGDLEDDLSMLRIPFAWRETVQGLMASMCSACLEEDRDAFDTAFRDMSAQTATIASNSDSQYAGPFKKWVDAVLAEVGSKCSQLEELFNQRQRWRTENEEDSNG